MTAWEKGTARIMVFFCGSHADQILGPSKVSINEIFPGGYPGIALRCLAKGCGKVATEFGYIDIKKLGAGDVVA